jgi:photosystem II stability/assembly factor-like uncharacterized protein
MPELRDLYDREAVASQINPPALAALEERARHRVRRNRVAGAAVIAALVAVPLLTIQGEDDLGGPPPLQTPSPSPSPPAAPALPPPLQDPGDHVVNLTFSNLSHGFAVHQTGPHDLCAAWLSTTEDGGSTWSELHQLPGSYHDESTEDDGGCFAPELVPVAAEILVLNELSDSPTSYISRDAGQTWQEYHPRARAADAVPAGVNLQTHCLSENLCEEQVLSWHDPETGDIVELSGNAPGAFTADVRVATDGSIWLAGIGAQTGYHVSVSRDRGRSWQTTTLGEDPDLTDLVNGAAFTTHDGVTAYCATRGSTAGRDGSGSLYRTVDGGMSWQRIADGRPVSPIFGLWVTPDGSLVAVDDRHGRYLSTDQGETFAPADLPVESVQPIPGGFYGMVSDPDRPHDAYLSEDGLVWRPVQAPSR